MGKIEFQGKDYPLVLVNLPFGEMLISTVSLNNVLMNNDGSYVSDEARTIDENIFYFVEDNILHLNENKLANKILSEI